MDRKPILEVKNISKSIANQKVVDRVSLDVYPGEIFGLLGPNGAGKTTLIRLIVGLMKVDQGEVLIEGHSVQTQFEKAIRSVGAVVENPKWYPFLTGYQNLRHFARMMPDIEKERIDEVVDFLDLKDVVDDPVHTYSLGMKQRLGLAQAILSRPRLLILDEPTNGLDPNGIHQMRHYLKKSAEEQHTAVLVSSHGLSEMQMMCDRFLILNAGRCLAIRSLKEEEKEEKELRVCFEVDDLKKAKTVLEDAYKDQNVQFGAGEFEIALKKDQIPELNAELMKQGVNVYGITTRTQTLEEKYLEMIEGDSCGSSDSAYTK